MMRHVPTALAAALALALSGCGSMDAAKVDYKTESTKKLPPLDVPPDLTTPGRDDRFVIPDTGKPSGATTLSAYDAERKAGPKPGTTPVLPDFDKVKIERTASERWLVVPEPPEKVWPTVKTFWRTGVPDQDRKFRDRRDGDRLGRKQGEGQGRPAPGRAHGVPERGKLDR
jgi:outer membrane protein assembly factor BamC